MYILDIKFHRSLKEDNLQYKTLPTYNTGNIWHTDFWKMWLKSKNSLKPNSIIKNLVYEEANINCREEKIRSQYVRPIKYSTEVSFIS